MFSELVRWTHIIGGSLALLTFWLPWLVKKGGVLHRRAGWTYVGAMVAVASSAFASCALRLLDADATNDPGAVFLAYVGLLSVASMWMGIRAPRAKRRTGPRLNPLDLGVAGLLSVGGVALVAWALTIGTVLFAAFGALGAVVAFGQLRYWVRPPAARMHWLYEHLGAMGTTCIATVTAFLVVNARSFGVGGMSLVLWIAPGVLGGLGITGWQLYYRRKYERPSERLLTATQAGD